MDINQTIKVLEALASGCSPSTGELVSESVINERIVIRALQIAIDELKKSSFYYTASIINIDVESIQYAINLLNREGINISTNNLTGFFLASKKFKTNIINTDQFYGKLIGVYSKAQLLEFFSEYMKVNKIGNTKRIQEDLYNQIDFFQKEKFNRLTDSAINQLKEKIDEIGILKTENLSEYIQNSRKNHPRAYEPWSEKEKELLVKSLKYTNDLDLLSECFQRGKGSIESLGKKIIYESQENSQEHQQT